MVLDIAMFREKKGGDLNRIRESERRRFADPANVDLVVALDEQWRAGLSLPSLSPPFRSQTP